ncbi:MAG: GNAT family N-acetyltransferase [Chloroflexota bacterium]
MENDPALTDSPYRQVTDTIRLRPLTLADVEIALPWYQDMEVLKYTAGIDRDSPYDVETVKRMYQYLMKIGECSIIEINTGTAWLPIGDVTLSQDTIPIVIGRKEYWGRGIAKNVLLHLIQRAKALGFTRLRAQEIYNFNARSLRLFKSLGFEELQKTEHGLEMELRFDP